MPGTTHLLLVAPEGPDRLLTAMLLTRQMEAILGSCDLVHAHSAGEGLARLGDTPIDACLVDASLESCLEFMRRARKAGFRRPVLLAVAGAGLDLREAAIAAGATDVVPKSGLSPATLGHAIQAAVLRARFEESLARSEERFQHAFRANPIGNTITSLATGRFLDVNDAFCALTGYGRAELVGRTSTEVGLFVDPAVRAPLVERLRRDGGYRDVELELRARGGRRIVALVSAQVMDIGGEPCILAALIDVTEHRATAAALQAREAQLQEAEALAGLGSWEWEPASGRVRWSPNLRRIVGVPDESTVGLAAYLDRVHPDDRDGVAATFERLRTEDGPLEHAHRILRPDGTAASVRARVHAQANADGKRRVLGIVQETRPLGQLGDGRLRLRLPGASP